MPVKLWNESDQRRQGNGAGHHWEVRLWGPRDVLPIPSSPTITAYPGQAVLGGDAPPALNFLVVVVNRGQNTGPAVSPRPSGRSWPRFSRLLGGRPFEISVQLRFMELRAASTQGLSTAWIIGRMTAGSPALSSLIEARSAKPLA